MNRWHAQVQTSASYYRETMKDRIVPRKQTVATLAEIVQLDESYQLESIVLSLEHARNRLTIMLMEQRAHPSDIHSITVDIIHLGALQQKLEWIVQFGVRYY